MWEYVTFSGVQRGHGYGVPRGGGGGRERELRAPVVRTEVCVRKKTTYVNGKHRCVS